MIWDSLLSDAVGEFYSECESMEGSLQIFLESILSEEFEVKGIRFVDGLFEFKVKSTEIYEAELEELRYMGFKCQSTRQYSNSVLCTFREYDL